MKMENLTDFLKAKTFKDIFLDDKGLYVLIAGVNSEDKLIETILTDEHPDWKVSGLEAANWLRRINETNALDILPLTSETIKAELSALLDIGELPIIPRDALPVKVQYIKELLEVAGLTAVGDVTHETITQLLSHLVEDHHGACEYWQPRVNQYDEDGVPVFKQT